MIVDQVLLAGDAARFQAAAAAGNPFDLSAGGGTIGPLPDGSALDVTGIALVLEKDSIENLFARDPATNEPLIQVRVTKEMFRGLFDDPYANRVYTIAGFEDFRRGISANVRVLEYEGVPTLVSVGSPDAAWLSPLFEFPKEVVFSSVAWDLAASKQTDKDAFRYSIEVLLWRVGADTAGAPTTVHPVAAGAVPTDSMFSVGTAKGSALRVQFKAEVRDEAAFHERHEALPQEISLGTPLLRSIHLLEPVPPAYSLMSLLELQARAREFIVHRGDPAAAPNALSAIIDLPCHLGRGESVSVKFAPGVFKRAEAWLVATSVTRPPALET